MTLGDHAFDQRDTLTYIDREPTLIRPINMPPGTPGRGANLIEGRNGHRVLVINALGRVFMDPVDDPFRAVEAAIAACPLGEQADAILVDFHTEATSEIQAMGFFLDGRASLVVGTHTHIPTSDARILKSGTALMADAGMCGDFNSVIGVDVEEPLNRFLTGISQGRFTPAEGEATLCGVAIETDPKTGLVTTVSPVRIGGSLEPGFALRLSLELEHGRRGRLALLLELDRRLEPRDLRLQQADAIVEFLHRHRIEQHAQLVSLRLFRQIVVEHLRRLSSEPGKFTANRLPGKHASA